MRLINCEISLQLKWSKNIYISRWCCSKSSKITDKKSYVPVVTLSTHDNVKILKQLESGFKRTLSWNKYQSKHSL